MTKETSSTSEQTGVPGNESHEGEGASVQRLLKSYLQLPASEQQKFFNVLAAMNGQDAASFATYHHNEDGDQEQEASLDADEEVENIKALLDGMAAYTPSAKLSRIEALIREAETEEGLALLEEEKSKLLKQDMTLVIQSAIRQQLTERPFMVLLAALGLGLGLFKLGGALFKLVF